MSEGDSLDDKTRVHRLVESQRVGKFSISAHRGLHKFQGQKYFVSHKQQVETSQVLYRDTKRVSDND
jgi:hypothetical protein